MFNVGDVVRAIKRKDGGEYYRVTNSNRLCEVVWVEGDYMGVRLVGRKLNFRVKCSTFKLEHIELENK